MGLRSTVAAMSLQPVEALDIAELLQLLEIRNQRVVRENSRDDHIIGRDEHIAWAEEVAQDTAQCFLAVLYQGKIVGGAGLRHIDPVAARAEWSFYLSRHEHGKGKGLALGVAALDHFFSEYQLFEIVGETLTHNAISQKVHLNLGFKLKSKRRREKGAEADFDEIITFGLTADAWRTRRAELFAVDGK